MPALGNLVAQNKAEVLETLDTAALKLETRVLGAFGASGAQVGDR